MTIDARGKEVFDRWQSAYTIVAEILKAHTECVKNPKHDKEFAQRLQHDWLQAQEQADKVLAELQKYRLDLPQLSNKAV